MFGRKINANEKYIFKKNCSENQCKIKIFFQKTVLFGKSMVSDSPDRIPVLRERYILARYILAHPPALLLAGSRDAADIS